VENVFELLHPFAIGLVVDGLLDDRWSGVAVLMAITLAQSPTTGIGCRTARGSAGCQRSRNGHTAGR
jgi:hypothetical protein